MIELYYDAVSLANYMLERDMTVQQQSRFKTWVQSQEYEYLNPKYKEKESAIDNKRVFMLDISRTLKDLVEGREEFIFSVKSYFMYLRLDILYGGSREFKRIKLRSLLSLFGYVRRREDLMRAMNDCMLFYHIQPYLKGGEYCDIRDIKVDDMISFRIL